jgi:Carboxypeptidase regulatory-like domain
VTRDVGFRCCALLLLAYCLPAVAQMGAIVAAPQAEEKPHTLRGQVVNSVTGEPIYRALVQTGSQFATLTDREGRFELEDVTTQGMDLRASKPGYSSESQYRLLPPVAPQQTDDEPVTVKLVPEAILSGTVTGSDGQPLEQVMVQLEVLSVYEGLPHWTQQAQTTTNSEGQYRFTDMRGGKYAVETAISMEGLPDEQSSTAYLPVRYPALGASPQSLAVTHGQHVEANLTAEIEKLYMVTGVVNGYEKNGGIAISATTAEGEKLVPPMQFNPENGEFRMNLPSGTFQLTATYYHQSGSKEARLTLTVPGAPVHGLAISLEPFASIPVEVIAETVSPPTAEGSAGEAPSVTLNLLSADPQDAPQTFLATPLSRIDKASSGPGARIFENIPPGRYRIQAITAPHWYVASAYCGGTDLIREEIVIAGGAVGCSIRVGLRNDSGSAHISVKTLTPDHSAKPAMIYVLPVDNLIRNSTTQWAQETELTIEGLAPGRYIVLALDRQLELPYRDPESLRRYAALGREIVITPNSSADAEVNLVEGELE